ncbi:MAG: GlgB N-terminal domain-containing protein [Candidatus Binataceae bacterium]
MAAALMPDQIDRLIRLEHSDPHSILGIHPEDGGVVVRAFRPGARDVSLLIEGLRPSRMGRLDDAGLFEVELKDRHEVFPYRLRAQYGSGEVVTSHDPYAFAPTLGPMDLYLWNEGRHERAWEKLGAHLLEINGVRGTAFAVWAPNARSVSVVGDFNSWDGRLHMMRALGSSGIWELFVPELQAGVKYKFEIRSWDGHLMLKADPFAFATETPPATASVVHQSTYSFGDSAWLETRRNRGALRSPMSIYELHLDSWRRVPEENNRPLTYREMAPILADYLNDLGFTHVELMPVMEHPFSGSWGYQITGYFAPTARFGTPDDFRYFVDHLHQRGIGVLLDWVPAHFPTDAFSLGRFDGTALFEHLDRRLGFHPEWNTYIFNFGRNEVRNFLLASALFLIDQYHADCLLFDSDASMLYLDYVLK